MMMTGMTRLDEFRHGVDLEQHRKSTDILMFDHSENEEHWIEKRVKLRDRDVFS